MHDIPKTHYNNAKIFQFADDIIHVVPSDSSTKNKNKQAIKKMQIELEKTLSWEEEWKIKTSIEKCKISFIGTTADSFYNHGGVSLRNIDIPLSNPIKLLGYNLNSYSNEVPHIKSVISKAKNNLYKLYRFRNAPLKIKRYLYVALIRPIMEYPCTEIANASKTQISKLHKFKTQLLGSLRIPNLEYEKHLKNSMRKQD